MSRLWVTPEELENESSSPFAYEACTTASFILWAFSGRKYTGTRTVTEVYDVPCRPTLSARQAREPGLFSVEPYLVNGAVMNAVCGCAGAVGGRHTKVRLRGRPVQSVQKVVSGSKVLDPSEYQVVNSSVLQAAPGGSLDVDGLEVTYTFGTEPPLAGRRAARHLAQQLAKAYSGDDCELPDRVTSVSRQGVSYTILDDQAFLDDLRTGVYSVDLFLRAVNPDRARKPARVFSPDMPHARRVTVNAQPSAGPRDLVVTPGEAATWSASLDDINGGILTDPDWVPQAQITSWNGALLLEFDAQRFTVQDGTLSFSLTAAETGRINIGGSGALDIYALNQVDGYTVIHVMTGNVYLV